MSETTLYDMLEELATMPATSGKEELVGEQLQTYLDGHLELETDARGNLYGTFEGEKDGTVLLCAHQDKLATPAGELVIDENGSHTIHLDNTALEREGMDGPLYIETPDSYVPTGQNAQYWQDETPPLEKALEPGTYPLLPEPAFETENEYVHGKLDDAVGLAVITDLLRTIDPADVPDIAVLYTVEEEQGLEGAKHFVEKTWPEQALEVDKTIVVDTSPKLDPGEGIVLYEQFNEEVGAGSSEVFVDELEETASQEDILLTTKYASVNDGLVLAKTCVPTVALETPIRNMHMPWETVAKQDIEELRNFLEQYLTDYF